HAERVALVEEHGSTTYAELDALVDRMARCLLAHGAGPGELVALHCDPTAVTLGWLLAVHRVGAAYLPLHTQADPVSAFKILDDARPVLLVSDREHPGLAEICPLVAPDAYQDAPADGPTELPLAPGADDPAYVIYTSGTTGEPKGVIVTHGNYLALKRATDTLMAFGPDDRWVLYHDTAFDFSVWEIFGALLSGGSLLIPDRFTIISPPMFATLVAEKGVTVLNQTPTAFSRNRLALDREGGARSLRYVIFGGERLTRKVWEPWVQDQGFEAPALVNMYGITETTVHVTFHQLGPADLETTDSRIGTVLPGFDQVVLDPDGAPATTGELHLAGPQVAAGYRGKPDLTARVFGPVAAADDGRTYYRTGDRVTQLDDGSLVYHDRCDRQLKYRGHRVEPAEIERAVEAVPGVDRAFVFLHAVETDESGPRHDGEADLACVFTAADEMAPAELRAAVSLPLYKTPTIFLQIPDIPLTRNGKVDQKHLRSLI
ncbi:MAG TPA: amino acid adenylation domain-containing protein, partial [Iamia sp.]